VKERSAAVTRPTCKQRSKKITTNKIFLLIIAYLSHGCE
jgi:hypothetical protein